MYRLTMFLLFVFAFATPVWAGSLEIESSISRSEVYIGEPIRYTLVLTYPIGTPLLTTPEDISVGDFTLETFGTETLQTQGDRIRANWRFEINAFKPGTYHLPPAVIRYLTPSGAEEEVTGRHFTITIISQLPEDWESEDIRDAKGLVELGARHPLLWALLILLACVAAGAWWLRCRRGKAAVQPPPLPPRPAHEVALEALTKLKEEELIGQNQWEVYYVRLSHILRVYLEGRFGYHAPRMSTEEFLHTILTAKEMALTNHRILVKAFLEECDRVKFARHRPSIVESIRALEVARRIVLETKPVKELVEAVVSVS